MRALAYQASYVGWVCCWFSTLLREVFPRILRFSPLLKLIFPNFNSIMECIDISERVLVNSLVLRQWANKLHYDFSEKREDLDKTGKKAGPKRKDEISFYENKDDSAKLLKRLKIAVVFPFSPSRTLWVFFRFSRGQNSFRWISIFPKRVQTIFRKTAVINILIEKHAFYELDVFYASQRTFSKVQPLKKFWKATPWMGVWNLDRNICSRSLRRFKRKLSVKSHNIETLSL